MRLIGILALILLPACGPPSNTVFIEVCGDVQIPADLDAVRISVLEANRDEHRTGTLDLLNCGGDSLALPQTTEIEAPFGEIWVVAQGLQNGVEVIRSERRLRIEEKGRAQDALLGLTRSCMRITCSLGQTCIDGVCEQAPWDEGDDGICSGGPPSDGAGGSTFMCPAETL